MTEPNGKRSRTGFSVFLSGIGRKTGGSIHYVARTGRSERLSFLTEITIHE